MIDFIKERYKKIKETKKFATERNVHNWFNIVLHSIMFSLLGGVLLTFGTIILLDDIESNSDLKHTVFMKLLWGITSASPFIFGFVIAILTMDKMIRLQVVLFERFNKIIFSAWQKMDMWYFKKYRKHSPLTENIAKLQEKTTKHKRKLSKSQKRLIGVAFIAFIILLQVYWRGPAIIESIENTAEEMDDAKKGDSKVVNPMVQDDKPYPYQVLEEPLEVEP